MTPPELKIEVPVRFKTEGRKRKVAGEQPNDDSASGGRLPRVSRLMALALRIERLVQDGEVASFAEVARLGHVTRARVAQIVGLLNLAPDIQEGILFLPPVERGRDPVSDRDLRPIACVHEWKKQRRMWRAMRVRPQKNLD